MTALCADELRREQQWERIRRDPELLEQVMAANRPRLMATARKVQAAMETDQ